MSLSYEKTKDNMPVAYHINDKVIIYYDKSHAKVDGKKVCSYMQTEPDDNLFPYIYGDTCIYVCASRGAGKSTFVSQYINSYHTITGNKMFFISRLKDDTSVDLPEKKSKRFTIGEFVNAHAEFASEGENLIETLKDSIICFDDIHDASLPPAVLKQLHNIILDVIENSRHYNINVCITSHMISNYSKTRAILNECSAIVIFPQYSNQHQMKSALDYYFGFAKEDIQDILDNDDRWVMVQTRQPKFILSSHKIYTYI